MTVPSDVCNGECVKTFTATQMLQVECRTFDRKRLPEANCDPKLRPYNRKECHTKRCATSLIVGSWGSVSDVGFVSLSLTRLSLLLKTL